MFYYEVFQKFSVEGVRYVIVGGLAVNLHGVPRLTQDLDIIILLNAENVGKTTNVLKQLGFLPSLPVAPEDLARPEVVKDWTENRNLVAFNFYHQEQGYKSVDIILVHPLDFEKAYENRIQRQVKDIEISLVSIEDLITMKEKSGRAQDLSDIQMLRRVRELAKK